jgi:hypothetical protein
MAYWARVGADSIVIEVQALNNDAATTDDIDDEAKAIAILNHAIQDETDQWIRTSFNANIRGKFAGIGDTYDEAEDVFYSASPFPSWIRTGAEWNPPTPVVSGYYWDEDTTTWIQPEKPEGMDSFTWQTTWGPGEEDRPMACWAPPVPYPGPYTEYDGGARSLPIIGEEDTYGWDEANQEWTLQVPE